MPDADVLYRLLCRAAELSNGPIFLAHATQGDVSRRAADDDDDDDDDVVVVDEDEDEERGAAPAI